MEQEQQAVGESLSKPDKVWEEDEVFEIGDAAINRAEEEYKFCLIGKFLTDKPVNEWEMRDALKRIWRMQREVVIDDVGKGLFSFNFKSPILLARVLEGGPWSFDDKLLILKKWSPDIDVEQYTFDTVETWVQVRGLRFHYQTEEIGHSVGRPLGKVNTVETRMDNDGGSGPYLRIRVTIPVSKPLRRGAQFLIKGEKTWVTYKYERIPNVCFYCGSITHMPMQCETPPTQPSSELPYGPWLLVPSSETEDKDVIMSSPVYPEISIDVAEGILLRLKVKDLVCDKTVSKALRALIKNPTFIKKHLLLHQSRKTIVATTNHPDEGEFQEIMSLSPYGHEHSKVYLPRPSGRGVGIVGSCNGLLCLLSEPDRKLLYLWNPSTREQPRVCYIADTYVKGIGFGYDAATGDYKAVKISSYPEEGKYSTEVWSMRTHGWRQIDSSFPSLTEDYCINASLFVGSSLYWLARSRNYPHKDLVVITFKMGDETFRGIALPDAFLSSAPSVTTLVDFMGSLALLVVVGERNDKNLFDIWMLDDKKNIFAKQFRMGPIRSRRAFPTGVCIDGKFLIRGEDKYILHDPRSKEEYEIAGPVHYQGQDEFRIDNPCWSFVESLVSVKAEP